MGKIEFSDLRDLGKLFDYDKLSEEKKLEIANLIKQDNLQKSNEKYPNLNVKNTFYTCFGKRLIDLFISGIALLVFFPINLFIGIVTMFDVGFPIFFKQKRIGKNGKPFTMIKFRNMTNKTDENGNLLRADLRVTKWGRFVRSTSLDELLNFVNIFKGDNIFSITNPISLISILETIEVTNKIKVICQLLAHALCLWYMREDLIVIMRHGIW